MADSEAEIRQVFADAGTDGWLHACEVDGDGEVSVGADEPVVLASVFKVPVLVELMRQVDDGRVELSERIRVPAARRTMGPTGLSVFADDVELSLRDLATSMMTVSDNTATDVIMERLGGAEVVNATLQELGCGETHIVGDCEQLLSELVAGLGLTDEYNEWRELPVEQLRACAQLQPAGSSRSTPRAMTRLLGMIWRDEAASPHGCAAMRQIMGMQVWPHRLTSGFPDAAAVSGKTGTLPGIRNEAGVVEWEGGRYAVAVFTVGHSFDSRQPAIDAAIGLGARRAVDHLKSFKRS